ncbi:MAG: sigma 54-interacting transcriptional regulator [Polyangiaceae bacterium]
MSHVDLEETQPAGEDVLAEGAELFALWDGGQLTRPLPPRGTTVLGRGADADVRIDHPSLSRRHVALHLGDAVACEDLGSANGTRVRGRRLASSERAELEWGEAIECGSVLVVVRPPARKRSTQLAAAATPVLAAAPARPVAAARPVAPESPIALEIPGADEFDADPLSGIERWIALVANTDMSVLLLGETGAGKGYFARQIHERSHRARGPFVHLNCAALPESLLESELFGHERGAFSGATAAKPGLLEAASGGTVFLDEIGDMPLATQAKLLVAIERREVLRVGALSPRAFDARFIAATNRDLATLSEDGRFRADLYFRLAGLPIEIPPLRDRLRELPSLAAELVRAAATKLGKTAAPSLTSAALATLTAHRWPGNVRELGTVLERAVLLAQDRPAVDADQVLAALGARPSRPRPDAPPSPPASAPAPTSAPANDERARIAAALESCGGNQSRAAELLGISRRTLINRIEEYGLPRPRRGG